MTDEELRTFYNVAFLKKADADPKQLFIYLGKKALPAETLAYKTRIVVPFVDDPVRDYDWNTPYLMPASSWDMCRDDGLVEWGWYQVDRKEQLWGIRLTKRGRDLLKASEP